MLRQFHCLAAAIFPALAMAQTWQQVPTSVPTRAAVFDASRHRMLLVGSDTQQRIHEWDGTVLRERRGELAGQKVVQHLQWDAALSRVIAVSEDRWVGTWNGGSWTWQTGGTPPPASVGSVAFDARRRRLVVARLADVYEWDGQQWWAIPSAVSLPAGCPFAYDPITQRCLLYGGYPSQGSHTYAWDGGAWTQLPASNQPGLRATAGMALDPARQQLVLCGGNATATDTWAWNGTSWSQLPTTQAPGPCETLLMTSADQGVALVSTHGSSKGQIWHLQGSTWRRAGFAAHDPASLVNTPFVYDPVRQVLVGWNSGTTLLFDRQWLEVAPTVSPPPRGTPQFAWSNVDQRALLFGGFTTTMWGDTWAWNGTDWQALQPQHAPSPRHGAMMVADPAGGVMLFGGTDLTQWFGDQWRWDGTDWRAVTAPNMPPARAYMRMVYDAVQATALMIGGYTTTTDYSRETWLWNGTTWSHPQTTFVPWFDGIPGVHPSSGRAIMMTQGATYEWSGSDWVVQSSVGYSSASSPIPRLATHPGRGHWWLCQPPVMRLLSTQLAVTEGYGWGCSLGPAPALAAIDQPSPGRTVEVELTARAPTAPAFLVVGLTAQNAPLGNGCRSLVAMPLAVNLAVADSAGIVRYPIPIPYTSALHGVRFTCQGAVWNPGASPLGSVTLSGGLLLTIGD